MDGRTDEEVLATFDQRVRHLHGLAADGVCPACNGRMKTTIHYEDECCLRLYLQVDHRCVRCRHRLCYPSNNTFPTLDVGVVDENDTKFGESIPFDGDALCRR